jgi:mRNA interferase RelE/StbE
MSKVTVRQMPAFKRAYKKLHPNQKGAVNEAIQAIITDPAIGEPKRGDLAGVYVYKFDVAGQRMLLAYEWDPSQRLLLALGVHENFYRDLKR